MTSQPGWHPDPVPPQAGQPLLLRYWDGTRWTEHTAPAQPPASTQGYAAGAPAAYPYATTAPGGPRTTPDGVPLAGWGHRAGALLIDWVILSVLTAVLALPWLRDLVDSYRDWLDQALNDTGGGTPDTGRLQDDIARPLAVLAVITLAVQLVYHVGFLLWRQATPGKLALGLRVRLRERPGPMPLGTVLLRWVAQFGIRIAGLLPLLGIISPVYLLLDYLWPLWDDKSQAIHDKVAKTNVVRVR